MWTATIFGFPKRRNGARFRTERATVTALDVRGSLWRRLTSQVLAPQDAGRAPPSARWEVGVDGYGPGWRKRFRWGRVLREVGGAALIALLVVLFFVVR